MGGREARDGQEWQFDKRPEGQQASFRRPVGGAREKPSHQWGSPAARLRRGGRGVHVAEEALNLPQGNTPTSVTHLGDVGHVRVCRPQFSPHPTRPSQIFLTPRGFPQPISWQEGSLHTTALWSPKSRVTYFDGKIFLAQGHHDLERWESEAGFMAFHSRSHGILWWKRGKTQ